MAAITLTQVENWFQDALDLAENVAPLAALGGPAAASIGKLVGEIATAGAAILQQVEGDAAIIAGGNLAALQALEKKLQASNPTLAAQIASS